MDAMLRCSDVSKRFGGLAAVDGFGCDVHANEIKVVIGPNGAGKTTLFNLLSGFLQPEDGGAIFFKGEAIAGARPHVLCKKGLARTFQIVRPFPALSVLQNVMIGALSRTNSTSEATDVSLEVLQDVGLERWRDAPAETLPIGHRKKLELARVLATKPQLIMLDEVMGGLTPPEVKQIVDLLHGIRGKGVTILMIEHILSAVMSLADTIVVMDRGRLLTEGKPTDVMNDHRVIEAYLGRDLAKRGLH